MQSGLGFERALFRPSVVVVQVAIREFNQLGVVQYTRFANLFSQSLHLSFHLDCGERRDIFVILKPLQTIQQAPAPVFAHSR